MISKFNHNSERFRIAIDLENKLLICQWLIDSFLLCRWHNDYLSERKSNSNAILWEITNETISNENFKEIEIIFKNKNNSRSSQQENLIVSELLHLQNKDKISSWKNENFENIFSENSSNQWECEKFELATSLCLSAKSEIIEFYNNHF
jgi:tRNA A22 N-methylase